MDNKQPVDNLEALFGKRFNDKMDISSEESWNQPSEVVWENIQAELDPNKKNKLLVFLPWMAVAASSLLLIGCFQLYQSNQASYPFTDFLAIKTSLIPSTDHSQLPFKKESTFNTLATDPSNKNHLLPSEKTIVGRSSEEHKALFVNKKINSLQQSVDPIAVPLTASLSFSATPLKSKDNKINLPKQPITPPIKNKPSFFIAANYSLLPQQHNNLANTIDSEGNVFSQSTQSIKTKLGGLQFGVKLKKGWTIVSGISYRHQQQETQHTALFTYKTAEEKENNQGVYENSVRLPLGFSDNTQVAFSLTREATRRPDEATTIPLEIMASKNTTALDIPLLVKKEWAVGNLGLSIRAGILNRFLIQNNLESVQITSANPTYKVSDIAIKSPSEKQNTLTPSSHLIAGVGVEYAFLPKLSFYVEPTFTRSLMQDIGEGYAEKRVDMGIRYLLQ